MSLRRLCYRTLLALLLGGAAIACASAALKIDFRQVVHGAGMYEKDGWLNFRGQSLEMVAAEFNRHNRRQLRIGDPPPEGWWWAANSG